MKAMKTRSGLRQRLTVGVLLYVIVVSLVVATHGYIVNERAEELVWKSLLESELAHFAERRAADRHYRWSDTEALRLYGALTNSPIPSVFLGLPAGVYDEVRTEDGLVVALVSRIDGEDSVLALDISDLERNEQNLAVSMVASAAAVVAVLVLVTHLAAGWLIRPLSSLARTVSSWSPGSGERRIAIEDSAPREAQIIAEALNDYAQRFDQFLERERAFINMASHELRTPIAVISGVAEVALDRDDTSPGARSYWQHVLGTTRDMERLMALLIALAKDPSRLRVAAERVELEKLMPVIIQDHEHLAKNKELSFELDVVEAAAITEPTQIVRAAVGNLVRNAIENSDRGTITVAVARPGKVIITDPGHGMSDEEKSALYTRLARSGELTGSGIGIDLISRLCAHLGWRLTFSSQPQRGTVAVLDFAPGAGSL